MRILTLTHNYPRFEGDPAGAFVARIAEGVVARGHQVEVIAPHAPKTATNDIVSGVRLHRFRYAPEGLERVAYSGNLHEGTLRSPVAAITFPAFLIAFERVVSSAVRRLMPDVIHAHWWLPGGWFASRRGVPYLITSHGSDVRLLERGGMVLRIARPVFAKARRVTAVSGFLARDLERLVPGAIRDVAVTPMPVDVARFTQGAHAIKAEPPRILYAGNLVASKGIDVVLRAAAELSRRGVPYRLKILGEGPHESELRQLALELGIDTQVEWSPFVSQTEMPAEYGKSTVTVLASRGRAEGLGLTLVEALLAGSAVVGTPVGGIPEVVQHERTGLLTQEGNPIDLADQIQRLLSDNSLRERLARAGKEQMLQTYSPASTIDRFLELYHVVAHDNPDR